MVRDLKIGAALFLATILGLNCAGCADLTRAMPYVNAGGDMLCASLEAVKDSRILHAKQRVSELEWAIAIAQDVETVIKLMAELDRANAELQEALKDAEKPAK